MLEEDNVNAAEPESVEPTPSEAPSTPAKRRRRGIDRTTIGLAALMALGAGGLYYMHAQTAQSVVIIDDAAANAASVETMLMGGRDGLTKLARNIEQTRDTIDSFTSSDAAALASARPLERDPFEFVPLEATQLTPLFGGNQLAREVARSRALEAARKLQLQSIMYGSTSRSCLVDGKLYFEGQPLGEFTLGRITPDGIMIQSGEFRFELRLRK